MIGLAASVASAASVADQWGAEFDPQTGVQKYVFTLQTDGDKLTGKAESEVDGRKREAELAAGKIAADTLSFVEKLNFQDHEIRIQYTGQIGTNEITYIQGFCSTTSSPTAKPCR